MLEQPPQNKMMTAAPKEKSGFHFAGRGIWHSAYIWAENIEEATKEWVKTRKQLEPVSDQTLEQSTAPTEAPKEIRATTTDLNDGGSQKTN
jgi:hypothetical protein